MWQVNFSDGSSVTSKEYYWDRLPKDRKLTGVMLSHTRMPDVHICLGDYDRYFWTKEAIALRGEENGTVLAEVLGAHDEKLGIVVEARLSVTGTIRIRTYPLSLYKYSQDILREGQRKSVTPTSSAGAQLPSHA